MPASVRSTGPAATRRRVKLKSRSSASSYSHNFQFVPKTSGELAGAQPFECSVGATLPRALPGTRLIVDASLDALGEVERELIDHERAIDVADMANRIELAGIGNVAPAQLVTGAHLAPKPETPANVDSRPLEKSVEVVLVGIGIHDRVEQMEHPQHRRFVEAVLPSQPRGVLKGIAGDGIVAALVKLATDPLLIDQEGIRAPVILAANQEPRARGFVAVVHISIGPQPEGRGRSVGHGEPDHRAVVADRGDRVALVGDLIRLSRSNRS